LEQKRAEREPLIATLTEELRHPIRHLFRRRVTSVFGR
jgi:hypothetical protein